jgi:hypothetical protein
MKKHQCICVICKTPFLGSRPTVKTCTKQCTGKYQSGANNPNFGNSWSSEQRKIASCLKKKQFADSPEYRYKAGSSNRGVKFDEARIKRMNENRTPESYSHPHSDESKKLIGKKSADKWTAEFKQSYRKIMEDRGYWIRIEDKDPYDIYYKESNWIQSMIEYLNEDEVTSLNKFGLFHQNSNSKGWVRDHFVPRLVGYEFDLPPQIMRHPANMRFVSHSENIKKGFADRKLTKKEKCDTIFLLIEKITNFEKEWAEHQWCLAYIRNNNENIYYE